MTSLTQELVNKLEGMLYDNKYINLGVERKVKVNNWQKDGKERDYIEVACFTANGKYKGKYKCGYVDVVTSEYVTTKYDDFNIETGDEC